MICLQDFDLCTVCYEKENHPHKMERLSFDLDGGDDGSGEAKAGNPGEPLAASCVLAKPSRHLGRPLSVVLTGRVGTNQPSFGQSACALFSAPAPLPSIASMLARSLARSPKHQLMPSFLLLF